MKSWWSRSKVFRDILYAQCWEDPEIDLIAFGIKSQDTVFSITSGGCNALSFLVDNPKKIICLDLSLYQNYLLSLKINAFRALRYHELVEFMGVCQSKSRSDLFNKIKPFLSEEERYYWGARMETIDQGIIHCGRYERYMHLLRLILQMIIGRKAINELYSSDSVFRREELYNKKWNNFRWRMFLKIFLSRPFASIYFDREFYKYLDQGFSFEKYYMTAAKKALTNLPLYENTFLAYILLGNYYGSFYPVYLRPQNYEQIRSRCDRIEIVTSECAKYFRSLPDGIIDKFNFTNIFEWMSPFEYESLLRETIRVAANGAIMTYRNHLVTRRRPESLADQIIPDEELGLKLNDIDLSFIYKAYVVETIRKSQ